MSLPPSPTTPSRNGTTRAQLLASFSASASPSSITKARRSSASISSSSSPSPTKSSEMRALATVEQSELSHSSVSRRSTRISFLEPKTAESSPINSSKIPKLVSTEKYTSSASHISYKVDEDVYDGDTIVVRAPPEQHAQAATSARVLRTRSLPSLKSEVNVNLLGHRRRSDRVKVATDNDTKKPVIRSPKAKKETDPSPTSRRKIREEIASVTKVKRDKFMLAHKDYFLPLLPQNSYISKLQSAKLSDDDVALSPYKLLEEQPENIMAVMKPYQLGGLSFLVHMHENGMSSILGDEMGLGKTLQTLSLIQYLENQKTTSESTGELRPYLVLCPNSVLSSWATETSKFTPGLKVLRFHGPPAERQRLKKVAMGQEDRYGNYLDQTKSSRGQRRQFTTGGATSQKVPFHIMITTYDTFKAEQGWLKTAFVWRYVILDEGHKIKNDVTQVATALQGLQAEYRLILTGTPLQNNLHEMWALLHWLYPTVFIKNTADLFKDSFNLTQGKVATSVIDHARRLLELIMLRRMKDSPGVNLGLPPRTDILLHVPLTPLQRFWYTRLLTNAGDGLLVDLFKDLKSKEKETLQQEAQLPDDTLTKVEALEKNIEGEPNGWYETKEIIMNSLAQEQKDDKNQSAWQRLHNLVMQLRKCCSHPYLLPNAAPEPFVLGDHIIRASGKFIVIEKLLRHIMFKQGEKVLIFSEFTKVLDWTEDLLYLMGGDGTSFKFMRLDGKSSRARRNLNMRLFNDVSSEYKLMLISTKAGGLGINLTAASNVIFLDETWNPQLTLQAEARAHRIGQTKPVTIYKLSTQGTVEEQMMGRIRKKLYLSAKITESMRSIHGTSETGPKKGRDAVNEEMPQLDTSQLKTLIRRGAQTLSHPEIDATEMLSWDLKTILEKCKDQVTDVPPIEEDSRADEEKWLSVMEKVETAVFDGRRYQKTLDKKDVKNILPEHVMRQDRRVGKNTTVMVDGFAISKESMNCGEWEAVPTLAGKDPRLADVKKEKRPSVNNQAFCQVCWDGGDVVLCQACPRSYHLHCLPESFQRLANGWKQFYCPQHECFDCQKKTTDAGGIIFRCRWCERGYCEDCLDWKRMSHFGESLNEYEALNFPANEQAYYIACPECNELHKDEQARTIKDNHLAYLDGTYSAYLKSIAASEKSARATSSAPSVDEFLTATSTLATNSEVATPITPIDVDELSDEFYGAKKRKAKHMLVKEARLGAKMQRVA